MTVRQLVGDCRVTLPMLPERSAQSCITSPPYYGLRDYGTTPLVWGGDPAEWGAGGIHIHEFGPEVRAPWANELPSAKSQTKRNNAFHDSMGKTAGCFCQCGAWLGSLGLEPTPDLYIEHLVECFRAVWRVLRDDGVLWLNLGDSYAGSGKGPSNSLNRSNPHSHDAAQTMKRGLNNLRDTPTSWMPIQRIGRQEHTIGHGHVPNLKPKDLMMMPARVALALQADGWTLRAQLPWVKRNCMPGSEKDRPSVSVEYVFLLSKSRRYFWDYGAARRVASDPSRKRFTPGRKFTDVQDTTGREVRNDGLARLGARMNNGEASGRNWRTGDLFLDSWQGLLADDEGDPLALVVNTAPLRSAHYATFPPKLVEPMVTASTRPGDTILDPFGGAGTVGLVADRMGRNAVLCELKPDYAAMGAERIVGDAPMFTEVAAD